MITQTKRRHVPRQFAIFCAWACTIICLPGFSQSFTSSNLPIVIINTNGQAIADEPKITADMGIIYNGPGVRNNVTDPPNNYNGKIGIEIRGSSSQMFPKKQYGIELRNAAGASIDASLLGLPKKDDWVLFAPYNDKSLMRDVLAYKLGRDLGRYASRSKYCEVILNGQYDGVYVLLEKVKRDKNRVPIDKLDPAEITGDNLTGGYIIKIDKASGNASDGWTSPYPPKGRTGNQTITLMYEYPKSEDIATEQKQYIQGYYNAFEGSFNSSIFTDPVVGYRKYIDVESFIDYFIVNELARNPDAYRISTFMYKQKDSEGGKLFMGPIWDFNLGFGNVNFCIREQPEGFVTDYNTICPGDNWLIPFWWSQLFKDDAFKSQLISRWATLRANQYHTSKIFAFIDSVATVLDAESQQRNFQRWPVLGQYVWPNAFIGSTFQSEVNWLKNWTALRLAWLDTHIAGLVTGVDDIPREKGFSVTVFPNPFSNQLELEYDISHPGTVAIDLLDITGSAIEKFEMRYEQVGKQHAFLQQPALKPGIYLLRVTFGNEVHFLKIIKQ